MLTKTVPTWVSALRDTQRQPPVPVEKSPRRPGRSFAAWGSLAAFLLVSIALGQAWAVDPSAISKTGFQVIKSIRVEDAENGAQRVLIDIEGYNPPKTFKIQGDSPRFVCDFFETVLEEGVPPRIDVGGPCITRIRSWYHKEETKVRVVLDLSPQAYYEVKQMFSLQERNIFILTIQKAREPSR